MYDGLVGERGQTGHDVAGNSNKPYSEGEIRLWRGVSGLLLFLALELFKSKVTVGKKFLC